MTKIRAVHQFFPVGQGLFAAGKVELWPRQRKRSRKLDVPTQPEPAEFGPFLWVYDCGSSSGKRLVSNAIAKLKSQCGGDKIDLLTLSHFHYDHISGVVELLNTIGAKTVMLPWAPLWHRLLIGFDQGFQADDPEMLFFVDPAAYLASEAGDGFERILFVMPSDGEGPPFLAEPPLLPEPPGDPTEREKDPGPGESADPEELELSNECDARRVRVLRSGKSISALGAWEFIPYNDPATRPSNPVQFAYEVAALRRSLLHGNKKERKGALKDLRALYEGTFKGPAINDVSLMLYGGALGNWHGTVWCDCVCLFHEATGIHCYLEQPDTRGAVLLTGDGNLSSAEKWSSLESYLDSRRARRVSVFQVPHHGAEGNWHSGLAAAISPMTSIFSSDPNHSYGHPHAEVLRDFWGFRAIQVDQHAGFKIQLNLER